ncbi:xanthine dehydrogenase small subunit [Trinickia caryophylli]|uniref:Xanthine dehydrogenase small subunit n=1 Tax=Trinickia caryophylli TaxID=28094 RepID=A0A1X7CLX2_TRICW|nr:xanthine dehydrogenase small subunit [Trinickia caryophylli]PMS11182.1 xanthine dehydrogenase small subunit [Trinickia caryophylli]TRX20039.1 xanthine dehydrogenase small subunit [Trinickia caryophylli]WQE12614.1 xanthine dehydrogenase small subunit [Trinickia caryophylli]SME98975.1 xanthine dehydrogenase small subunit [Trinickia caryophylli]GLU30313.1 xanthine dehydrogenase [Trinickia caryophylli]
MTTHSIRFYYRGAVHHVQGAPSTRTVLQYLREDLRCTGTKEGCAEGDCGACTVVIGELDPYGALVLKPVNACIQFLPTLDSRALFTVEDLRGKDGRLHPLQRSLVDCHGSQCGFCTPGFAMSMWALYENRLPAAGAPSREEIATALSGNLCRCTGYRPIVDACQAMFDETHHPRVALDRAPIANALLGLKREGTFEYAGAKPGDGTGAKFFAPTTVDALAALRLAHPHARVLAGGTDVALQVTKQLRAPGDLIYIGGVSALKTIERTGEAIVIGAAASLEDAYTALTADYPMLAEFARRFASLPIRQAGTLGGNVANGSPIGDSMPVLIALGAQLVLRRGAQERVLPLDAFYLGYQKTALEPGEFVAALHVPRPRPPLRFRAYKVSKRYDQDISAVCGAFAIETADGTVTSARIAFGGMAATPKRASAAEAVLEGGAWDEAALRRAMAALAGDFVPLTDMRATSRYRMTVARNLLRRFYLETREDAPLGATELDVFAFGQAHAPCARESA